MWLILFLFIIRNREQGYGVARRVSGGDTVTLSSVGVVCLLGRFTGNHNGESYLGYGVDLKGSLHTRNRAWRVLPWVDQGQGEQTLLCTKKDKLQGETQSELHPVC